MQAAASGAVAPAAEGPARRGGSDAAAAGSRPSATQQLDLMEQGAPECLRDEPAAQEEQRQQQPGASTSGRAPDLAGEPVKASRPPAHLPPVPQGCRAISQR